MAFQPILGPRFGRWADKIQARLPVILYSCGLQALTSTVAIVLLACLLLGQDASSRSNDVIIGGMNSYALSIFALICLCGIAENTGANILSVAIEKDWLPTVFEGFSGSEDADADDLTQMNANMGRIDLCAEFTGPVIAGLLLSFFDEDTLAGFTCIALMNILSFVPQYYLLRSIYNGCARLRQARDVSEAEAIATAAATMSENSATSSESTALLGTNGSLHACAETPWLKGWFIWAAHPGGVQLVSCAYALLYFFSLSPHGIPITAYLASVANVPPAKLAIFRGFGALSGVLGLTVFEIVKKHIGLRRASLFHIIGEAVAVYVACWYFSSNTMIFMVAVILSRMGLYGFDLGYTELQQRHVSEDHRNVVGQVDSSLTSLFTTLMYLASLHIDTAEKFESVAWASAGAVATAVLIFSLYLALFHDHMHTHMEGELEGAGNVHPHTAQEMRALHKSGTGTHSHVHYTGPPVWFPFGAALSPRAHDHDHSHSHDHAHA